MCRLIVQLVVHFALQENEFGQRLSRDQSSGRRHPTFKLSCLYEIDIKLSVPQKRGSCTECCVLTTKSAKLGSNRWNMAPVTSSQSINLPIEEQDQEQHQVGSISWRVRCRCFRSMKTELSCLRHHPGNDLASRFWAGRAHRVELQNTEGL